MNETCKQGNILIIDDDNDASKLLCYNLKNEGFDVHYHKSAADVSIEFLSEMRLVIVDSMNQSFTGMDLLVHMKNNSQTANTPIMIICFPDSEDLIIKAFEYGVDDFVTKPFSLREMLARINAVLRRYPMKSQQRPHRIVEGITIRHLDLHIDTINHRVLKSGVIVPLTKTEYSIFVFLIKHQNIFYTRDQIYDQIWKDEPNINTRIVDTNISRLRKKLGEAAKSIINRYGMGYAFIDNIS